MTATDVIERIDRVFAAVERTDLDAAMTAVEAVAAPDVTFTGAAGGREYAGLEGVRQWFRDLTGPFEVRYEDREFIEGEHGSIVFLANVHLHGRSSDAHLLLDVATVFEFDSSGRVVRATTYDSPSEALKEAGA